MAKTTKKNTPNTNLSLEKLIPLYGKTKEQLDECKKAADLQNKKIKELMRTQGKDSTSVEGWVAKYDIRNSESFNEEAMIEYMHQHKEFEECIKLKEYIDMDALENLLYNGKLPKKLVTGLDKFRVTKSTEYLTIKRLKE